MPGLIALRFDIAHRRQIASLRRGQQIVEVILVVGDAGMSYFGNISRPRVSQVAGLRVVLKRRVLTIVIIDDKQSHRIGMAALTSRRAVGINCLQIESAFEGAPAYLLCVEQIAYVLSRHLNCVGSAGEADVAGRLCVRDKSAIEYQLRVGRSGNSTVGLSRDKVDMSRQSAAEGGAVRIVAHREVLRVI